MRDDEVAAALAGLNVARLRILAFVVSAACAGLAASLLAVCTGDWSSPGAFTVTLSIALLTAAVIGGLGSLAGAIWGSLAARPGADLLSPTWPPATACPAPPAPTSRSPAYGVVLIVVMLVFPGGIQGGAAPASGPHPAGRRSSRAPASIPAPAPPASEHEKEGTT